MLSHGKIMGHDPRRGIFSFLVVIQLLPLPSEIGKENVEKVKPRVGSEEVRDKQESKLTFDRFLSRWEEVEE